MKKVMGNDKQRLVELLQKASKHLGNKFISSDCDTRLSMLDRVNELRADYLLANGVIVPPCEIGTPVYIVLEDYIDEQFVKYINIGEKGTEIVAMPKTRNKFGIGFSENMIGKKVFFSREEAEQALVNYGSSKNDIERKEDNEK